MKMAPPRFQCLNATRAVVKQSSSLRAGFSTSRIVQADGPLRPPTATSSLISSVFGSSSPAPSQSAPPPQRAIPQFSNPVVPTKFKKLQSLHPGLSQASERVMNLLNRAAERRKRLEADGSSTTADEVQKYARAADLSKQITRRWKAGDIYAPHDLSGVEMAKWKKRGKPNHDVFDVLDINPMDYYRNFSIMSEYMTPMGRIEKSEKTGLRPVNQRRIARAIRRSIGIGIMPSVHRHPEILYKMAERHENNTATFRQNMPL